MSRVHALLLRLGMVAAPVLLVLAMPALREARGPASASALPLSLTEPAPNPAPALHEPSQAALDAEAHALRLSAFREVRSPFYSVRLEQPEPVIETDTVTVEERPTIAVTSILSGSRPVAVINGRPMGVGGLIDGQWTLIEIDAARGLVRFEHRHDADRYFTARLSRDLPGG